MGSAKLVCVDCGKTYDLQEMYRCPADNGELTFAYDYEALAKDGGFIRRFMGEGKMWDRFFDILPLRDKRHIVSLGEGNTPLISADRLAKHLGIKKLWLKLECCNPTGSFKDRQMTLAVSNGNEWGKRNFCTVSSGNVGNALSAYCASQGFAANVWVSDDTAKTKYEQIQIYGAQLFLFPNPTQNDPAYHHHFFYGLLDFCREQNMVPAISARPVNPYMVEGTKTISFEIFSQLKQTPQCVFAPLGGGGMFSGTWKGFKEIERLGLTGDKPDMFGCQVQGYMHPINRLGDKTFDGKGYSMPLDGLWAQESLGEGTGGYVSVTAQETLEAQKILATMAGVFTEPQGAHSAAGMIQMARQGKLKDYDQVVCVITGNGLKDNRAAVTMLQDSGCYPSIRNVKSFADCTQYLRKDTSA